MCNCVHVKGDIVCKSGELERVIYVAVHEETGRFDWRNFCLDLVHRSMRTLANG